MVDGKCYRYMVNCKAKSLDPNDHPQILVTIQEDEHHPGRCLRFRWPGGHSVLPRDIEQAIRDGRKLGWDPTVRGGAFDLDWDSGPALTWSP